MKIAARHGVLRDEEVMAYVWSRDDGPHAGQQLFSPREEV